MEGTGGIAGEMARRVKPPHRQQAARHAAVGGYIAAVGGLSPRGRAAVLVGLCTQALDPFTQALHPRFLSQNLDQFSPALHPRFLSQNLDPCHALHSST
jgi:hypothetical protein